MNISSTTTRPPLSHSHSRSHSPAPTLNPTLAAPTQTRTQTQPPVPGQTLQVTTTMRPQSLTPLFAEVQSLDGIGPRLAQRLSKLTLAGAEPGRGARVLDLLWHFPTGLTDRRARPKIQAAKPGALATLEVTVSHHQPPPARNARAPYKVYCEDETGVIELIFFRGERRYLERLLPVGAKRLISGKVEQFGMRKQMPHPDHVVAPENAADLPLLEPVYPLTQGLSAKVLRKALGAALTRLPELDEWQEANWLRQQQWPSFAEALRLVHAPQSADELLPATPARRRLAFDELLANQLALGMVRGAARKIAGRAFRPKRALHGKILQALPFELTAAQQQVLREIDADMASETRMLRLLQGDVGAGKTVVALMAMANAIECGTQAAIMAPTEVLARQHFKGFAKICDQLGLRLGLLTGREKGRKRDQVLAALAAGEIDIMVGTHALFQDDVAFRDLGLAVIDEQHRFGVHQRLALQAKGAAGADLLVMTATPIPRTLLLTHYGDMEVSKLTGKPAGRKPIRTTLVSNERLDEVIAGLKRAIARGDQIYWVCPLVEDSDKLELAAAEARHAHLQQHFGDKVGLVHGRMAGRDKDKVMAAFSAGELDILVSTTVIEVGVDVPNATIMVIEHAERFGLAQLHQLRGRVGRGDKASSCILLYQGPLSQTGRARLEIMRETEDGFRIAEEDLRLRGGGEILGTRQSGDPGFRIANLPEHTDLLAAARDDARLILAQDPNLTGPRGAALKTLLYLFERDDAIKLLRAG